MTTYQVTSNRDGYELIASWPDLPERVDHPVGTFGEEKLATATRSVLNAASRYRWHRWIQLYDEGVFTEERAGEDPVDRPTDEHLSLGSATTSAPSRWLPRLPTGVILGDSPMSGYLEGRIESLIKDPGQPGAQDEADDRGVHRTCCDREPAAPPVD